VCSWPNIAATITLWYICSRLTNFLLKDGLIQLTFPHRPQTPGGKWPAINTCSIQYTCSLNVNNFSHHCYYCIITVPHICQAHVSYKYCSNFRHFQKLSSVSPLASFKFPLSADKNYHWNWLYTQSVCHRWFSPFSCCNELGYIFNQTIFQNKYQ